MTWQDDLSALAARLPDPVTMIEQNVHDSRLVIGRARLAADLARRVSGADGKPRVVVRCPVRCGGTVGLVYETDHGPLYTAEIRGVSDDRREVNRPPWEQLDRLASLDAAIVDDDDALFLAAARVVRNVPVMPGDETPDKAPIETHAVLIDEPPAPLLVQLWWRCPRHYSACEIPRCRDRVTCPDHANGVGKVDPDAVLDAYRDAIARGVYRQPFMAAVGAVL